MIIRLLCMTDKEMMRLGNDDFFLHFFTEKLLLESVILQFCNFCLRKVSADMAEDDWC